MDAFMKTLSIRSSDNIDEILEVCPKILELLSVNEGTDLDYRDVETLIKAAVFMREIFEMFGDELKDALLAKYPFYESLLQNFMRTGFIPCISTKILHSKDGLQHANSLELIIKSINHINPQKTEIIPTNDSEAKPLSANQKKMLFLTEKLFELPAHQIDCAIDRLLKKLHFNVIGFVFQETKTSHSFVKSTILVQKICNKLATGTIDPYFIHTMFITSAMSEQGIRFYWKCVENRIFARSLRIFLKSYLSSLDVVTEEKFSCEKMPYQNFLMSDIFFLAHCLLRNKSPAQIGFYNDLSDSHVSECVLRTINKIDFICD